MGTGEKLIGNSAFLFIDWLVITVLSLVFWLIIGKFMPKEVYGTVATAVNIITILSGIALLGLQTTIIKLISEFGEKNQVGKIRNLVRFTARVGLSVSLVLSVLMVVLSPFLSSILNLPMNVLFLIGIGIFVFSLWGITTSVMLGLQNMKGLMKTDIVGNIVKVSITLSLVLLGFSYFGPLAGVILGIIAIILLRYNVLMLFRRGPERLKSVRLDFSSIFMYSLSAFVASIAMVGFANTPNIILNVLVGSAVTGLFAVSLTITSPIFTIPSVLNSALFPIMSSLSANKGGRVSQKILINMVLRYAFLITLPIIAILMIFSDTIILFFSSGDFLPAKQFLPIVGIGGFIFGIGGILNSSIYAIRKPVISRNITLLTFIIFLSLSIPLSILFSGMGMAIAYLISVFVFCSASAVYLKKFIGLSIDWISIAKVLAVVVVFASILFGINFVASSTLLKVVGVLLASLIYFILLIPLKFYKKEDLRILGFLSDKSPIGRGIFDRIKITLSRFV